MSRRSALLTAAVLLTVLMTPALAAAQSFSGNSIVDFIWVKTFHFQSSWLLQPNQLLLQAIIPSVAIYAIFLGLMRTLRIFYGMGSMEHVIALCVTFAALFTGGIGYISALLSFMGQWSVIIFFILFFVGSILYARGFIRGRLYQPEQILKQGYHKSAGRLNQRIDATEKKIEELEKRYQKLKTITERAKLAAQIEDLRVVLSGLERERNELNKQLNTALSTTT